MKPDILKNKLYYKHLFGKNYRFKRSYSDFINGIMRRIFQPIGYWGKLLGAEGNYGVINTHTPLNKATMNDKIREFYIKVHDHTDPKWSLLNYVNTHYTAFVIIIDFMNELIDKNKIQNEDYFTFKDDIYDELERLKPYISKYGKYIFLAEYNLGVFWDIMGAIATTTYIGNRGENKTLETLAELGDITDIIKSRPGERIDTHGGVDLRFKLNGIRKTLQCKTFTNVKFENGQFIFKSISNPSDYDVDFFSFVSSDTIYVFDTKKNGLRYKFNEYSISYTFDQTLLRYKLNI
jgi:hypothetical protein